MPVSREGSFTIQDRVIRRRFSVVSEVKVRLVIEQVYQEKGTSGETFVMTFVSILRGKPDDFVQSCSRPLG